MGETVIDETVSEAAETVVEATGEAVSGAAEIVTEAVQPAADTGETVIAETEPTAEATTPATEHVTETPETGGGTDSTGETGDGTGSDDTGGTVMPEQDLSAEVEAAADATGDQLDKEANEESPKTAQKTAAEKDEGDGGEGDPEGLDEEGQDNAGAAQTQKMDGVNAQKMSQEELFRFYERLRQDSEGNIQKIDTTKDGALEISLASGFKFQDNGTQITCGSNPGDKFHPDDVYAMMRAAREKGWDSIKLTGTDEFKEAAWLEAQRQGVGVEGFSPSPELIAQWEQEKAENPDLYGPDQDHGIKAESEGNAPGGFEIERDDLSAETGKTQGKDQQTTGSPTIPATAEAVKAQLAESRLNNQWVNLTPGIETKAATREDGTSEIIAESAKPKDLGEVKQAYEDALRDNVDNIAAAKLGRTEDGVDVTVLNTKSGAQISDLGDAIEVQARSGQELTDADLKLAADIARVRGYGTPEKTAGTPELDARLTEMTGHAATGAEEVSEAQESVEQTPEAVAEAEAERGNGTQAEIRNEESETARTPEPVKDQQLFMQPKQASTKDSGAVETDMLAALEMNRSIIAEVNKTKTSAGRDVTEIKTKNGTTIADFGDSIGIANSHREVSAADMQLAADMSAARGFDLSDMDMTSPSQTLQDRMMEVNQATHAALPAQKDGLEIQPTTNQPGDKQPVEESRETGPDRTGTAPGIEARTAAETEVRTGTVNGIENPAATPERPNVAVASKNLEEKRRMFETNNSGAKSNGNGNGNDRDPNVPDIGQTTNKPQSQTQTGQQSLLQARNMKVNA